MSGNRSETRFFVLLVAAGIAAFLWGCGGGGNKEGGTETSGTAMNNPDESTPPPEPQRARAELRPTEGNTAGGTVLFEETPDGVRVRAELSGLAPGLHGFHIHETGDCTAPDASSAGGHFNPAGSPHGGPEDPSSGRHVGDLGNIVAGAEGVARYDRVDPLIRLSGVNSIVGRAVVVHAGEDDLESQPSGDAGVRVACGVIRLEPAAGGY